MSLFESKFKVSFKALGEQNYVHKMVMSLFSFEAGETKARFNREITYSCKPTLTSVNLIVRSNVKPNINNIDNNKFFKEVFYVKEILINDIQDNCSFKIHVSPSRKESSGKQKHLSNTKDIIQWFLNKISKEKSFDIISMKAEHEGIIEIENHGLRNSAFVYGELKVKDKEEFFRFVKKGFGGSKTKSYGFGLVEFTSI